MTRFIPDFGSSRRPVHEANPDPSISGQLAFWLGRTSCGESVRLGSIDVVPIVHPGPFAVAPMLLHDAIASGALTIGEHGGGGAVNSVVAQNTGKTPVLILEGESIVGAMQNRVVTMDVLLAPESKVEVPVGCVEHGRWRSTSKDFRAADMPLEPSLRRRTVREMSEEGRLNQGRLWADVADTLERSQLRSSSGDYHEVTTRKRGELEDQLKHMPRAGNQVGMIAFLDGQLLAMDMLGSPENWTSMAERLTKAYLLAGMNAPVMAGHAGFAAGATLPAEQQSVDAWLRRIAGSHVRVRPGVSMGTQLMLAAPGLTGAGLWTDDGPAHVAVFGE